MVEVIEMSSAGQRSGMEVPLGAVHGWLNPTTGRSLPMSRQLLRTTLLLGVMTLASRATVYAQTGAAPLEIGRPSFRVRVYNDEHVPKEVLSAAQKIAGVVLRRAGLQAIWQECTVGSLDRDASCCDMHSSQIDLVLYLVAQLEAHAPNVDGSALGYSIIPDNGEPATMAYVCYSRVKTLGSAFSTGELLGMAMAHEVGHLLFNSNEHSCRGLMRATWPRKDLDTGHQEEFMFTSEQARHLCAVVAKKLIKDLGSCDASSAAHSSNPASK